MATNAAAVTGSPARWSPARFFMAASAAFHLPVAIIGLVIDPTFPIGAEAVSHAGSEHILGVLETNGWHSLAALLVGLVSLFYALYPRGARTGALVLGVGHVFVVLSLVLWDPSTFWLASNAADQVVHASTAVGGIGSALLTRRAAEHG